MFRGKLAVLRACVPPCVVGGVFILVMGLASSALAAPSNTDLGISIAESGDPVVPGSGVGNLTYTVTLINNGSLDATNVTVDVVTTVPAGVTVDSVMPSGSTTFVGTTWSIAGITVGNTETLTIAITADGAAADGVDVIDVSASITGADQPLKKLGDDSAVEATSIDSTPPTTIAVNPATVGPTNAASVDVTVRFDEDVVNFNDESDLVILHTGTAHTGVVVVGGPRNFTVTLSGVSGDGSFTVATKTERSEDVV